MAEKFEFESDFLKLIEKERILFAHYKAGIMFDLKVSKIIVSERLNFLSGRVLSIIVIDEGVISMEGMPETILHLLKVQKV